MVVPHISYSLLWRLQILLKKVDLEDERCLSQNKCFFLTWRPVLDTMSPHDRREEWIPNVVLWPLLVQMRAHTSKGTCCMIEKLITQNDSAILKREFWLQGCRHIELVLLHVCRADTWIGHQHSCLWTSRKNRISYVSKAEPFLSVIYWFLSVINNINDYINYKKVWGRKVSNLFH